MMKNISFFFCAPRLYKSVCRNTLHHCAPLRRSVKERFADAPPKVDQNPLTDSLTASGQLLTGQTRTRPQNHKIDVSRELEGVQRKEDDS